MPQLNTDSDTETIQEEITRLTRLLHERGVRTNLPIGLTPRLGMPTPWHPGIAPTFKAQPVFIEQRDPVINFGWLTNSKENMSVSIEMRSKNNEPALDPLTVNPGTTLQCKDNLMPDATYEGIVLPGSYVRLAFVTPYKHRPNEPEYTHIELKSLAGWTKT